MGAGETEEGDGGCFGHGEFRWGFLQFNDMGAEWEWFGFATMRAGGIIPANEGKVTILFDWHRDISREAQWYGCAAGSG
jgi:hypothetical protein